MWNQLAVKLMKSYETEKEAYLHLGRYIQEHLSEYFKAWIEDIEDCLEEEQKLYAPLIKLIKDDEDFMAKILTSYQLFKLACQYVDNLQRYDTTECIEFVYGVNET